MKVKKTTIPDKSLAKQFLPADYEDTFVCTLPSNSRFDFSADDIQVSFWTDSPKWVQDLFKIRNSIVSLLGLKADKKDEKSIENCIRDNKAHDIFSVTVKNENETVLCLTDKHLNAYISILIDKDENSTSIYTITIVHMHNLLGKIYFYSILPFHTIVVKGMVRYTINKMLKKA